MAQGKDHYAVLGLKDTATAAQIKAAYHRRAKAAHPDAGGNVEAMAQVNEAYHLLSDPVARHLYDTRAADASENRQPYSGRPRRYISEDPHATEYREAERIDRERNAWARHSAWEMARLSAPVAVVVIIVTQFTISHTTSQAAREAAALLAFIPVYAFTLSVVFLISPSLRLIFADLIRRYPTAKGARRSALALILAFVPLAVIWVLLFSVAF